MKLKNFLRAIWELPQNLLGRAVLQVSKARFYDKAIPNDSVNVYIWNNGGGMSLGNYIFIPHEYVPPSYVKHEYGHCIQSRYLGWLYLLVIGLPSLIWSQCFRWFWKKPNITYYWLYTEKWADKLGGVDR